MRSTRHRYRLQRRGHTWVYRRRVPVDLVPLLGRREIVRALRADSLKDACRLAALLDARVWRVFDAVRARSMDAREVEELIERLCGDYLRELVEEDRIDRRGRRVDDDIDLALSDAIEAEAERLDRGKVDHVRQDAAALLVKVGQELDEDALDALLWELVRTRMVAFRLMREEREGDAAGRPRVALGAPSGPKAAPVAPSPMLSEVIQRYVEDHKGKTWAPRTGMMIESGLAELLEIVGDKPSRAVSKEDVRRYRLTLDKLPAHLGVRHAGRSIADVLAENPEPGLSPATIRKRMSYVISLFRYAVRMEWIERNPADGMRPPKGKQVHRERDEFTDEDLRTIFGRDYRSATLGKGNHARYWIPLALLFTGARLEEIAQLETADVAEVDGVACIRITARSAAVAGKGEGKSLKTVGSDRTVPIHSGLIALGFLDYVAQRRTAGDRRVFPRLRRGSNRGYGGVVSKWFTRWKRAHGVTSRTKVLHSLRHTFATRLKAADVQDHSISELLGHEVESITVGRYGKRLSVAKLREAVEKFDVGQGLSAL